MLRKERLWAVDLAYKALKKVHITQPIEGSLRWLRRSW